MNDEKDFELRPNGKVWFKVGAQEHLCRRPTVGDLGKILELYAEMGEKERVAVEGKDKETFAEQITRTSDLVSQWTHDALGMLSDPGMPAVSEMPAWAGNASIGIKLITHWRDVPLAPSGG